MKNRLNRDLKNPFGSEAYAKEELRAEIFSLIIGTELNLGHDPEQHTAYVKSWIKVIKDDYQEIFRAAADAEKMQEYVLSFENVLEIENTQDEAIPMVLDKGSTEGEGDGSLEGRYINVPFKDKEEAKQLGARWDRCKQSWYVPEGIGLEQFTKWQVNLENNLINNTKISLDSAVARKQYLAVPYKDRIEAKKAGAMWDKSAKSWYVNHGTDMTKLATFLPGKRWEQLPAMTVNEEFTNFLSSLGLIVGSGHPLMDGNQHRIAAIGDKPGEAAGFYVAHSDGHPAGYAINNRTGEESKWKSKGYFLDEKQRANLDATAEIKKQQRLEERLAREEQTANICAKRIEKYVHVSTATPYLKSKKLTISEGIYTDNQRLKTFVPAYDVNGKAWSIQTIGEDGSKRFAKDSRKEGCFHVVGGLEKLGQAEILIIAEGYSTAATLAEVLNIPAVAAFDSGNLPRVAKTLHDNFPDKPILIAGDNDIYLEKTQGKNPGQKMALSAALVSGGKCIFPNFTLEEMRDNPKAFTDFNDMAVKSILGRSGIEHLLGPIIKDLANKQYSKQLANKIKV